MSDKDRNSSSPHAMYGNVTTHHESPASDGGLLRVNSMFPSSDSSHAHIKNDVDSVIEFINDRKQRLNDNASVMKVLHHQRQRMMANLKLNIDNSATLPVPMGGAFLQLESGGSDLDAFQYHLSQDLGMDILHHADALDAAGPPVSMKAAGQHQAWAALSYNMQTSMTEMGDKGLPCGEVARYHDKRTFTPTHATSLHTEIGFGSAGSCLPGQTLTPAAAYASNNGDDHARSSVSALPGDEIGRPTVVSFMSGGFKHYRCECGYESARKRDIDHHLESLQHSERKYKCSCGRKFTRYDSLHRHKRRKMKKPMGSRA